MSRATVDEVRRISSGYDADPACSMSLRSAAYVEPQWLDVEMAAVFARTWQWICHVEQLARPGSHVASTVAGMPVAVVRDKAGVLRGFYDVCKHRAHELLSGTGITRNIVCPNRWWDDLGRPHLADATAARLVEGLPANDINDLVAKRDALLAAVIATTHGLP